MPPCTATAPRVEGQSNRRTERSLNQDTTASANTQPQTAADDERRRRPGNYKDDDVWAPCKLTTPESETGQQGQLTDE